MKMSQSFYTGNTSQACSLFNDRELKKWISEKRSMVALEEETRNSHPQAQLQRLLQSEESRLSIENTRVNEERRKEEAQKKFLHQMAVYHPLSPIENRKSVKGKRLLSFFFHCSTVQIPKWRGIVVVPKNSTKNIFQKLDKVSFPKQSFKSRAKVYIF